MQKILIPFLFILSILTGCKSEKKVEGKNGYLRWVGDIEQNDQIDEPDFKVCNGDYKILQYFNLGEGPVYDGEKLKILNTFNSKYKPISDRNENGLIRVRFIVNCKGKAGRFRILQSDYSYQEKKFDKDIISQLLIITKGIENWKIFQKNKVPVDYYMYLIFKIRDGQLTEILP